MSQAQNNDVFVNMWLDLGVVPKILYLSFGKILRKVSKKHI